MSSGITVKTLDIAGGRQLNGGQSFFNVDAALVVLLGDPVEPHGPGIHAAPKMVEGSSWMDLNGTPVCREGHLASCGHKTTGRAWFRIP